MEKSIVTGAGDETLRFWNVFTKCRANKESDSVLNLFNQNSLISASSKLTRAIISTCVSALSFTTVVCFHYLCLLVPFFLFFRFFILYTQCFFLVVVLLRFFPPFLLRCFGKHFSCEIFCTLMSLWIKSRETRRTIFIHNSLSEVQREHRWKSRLWKGLMFLSRTRGDERQCHSRGLVAGNTSDFFLLFNSVCQRGMFSASHPKTTQGH